MKNEKLPKGWVKVKLGDIAETSSGGTPNRKNSEFYNGTINWVKSGELNQKVIFDTEEKITEEGLQNSSAKIFPKDTLLIALYGATVGKLAFLGMEAATNQAVCGISISSFANKNYIYYFLSFYKDELLNQRTGSAQPNISQNIVNSILIPFPPKLEQDRIVAEIETVLEWVDLAQTELNKIPALLKAFRQKVLAMAVSGELTANFRKNTKEVKMGWTYGKIKDISHHTLGKMLDKVKNIGEPTEYLRNINVRWFKFDLNDIGIIQATESDKHKFNIQDGDILICEGGEPGRCAIWDLGETDIIFQKALHRVRLKTHILPKWFTYNLFLDAQNGKLSEVFTGTTIQHFTSRVLAEYEIPIPPFTEQNEIVSRITELFDFADEVEAQYTEGVTHLKKLPQSLFQKAFTGALVNQDPTDESVSTLLEHIKLEKERLIIQRVNDQKEKRYLTKTQPKMAKELLNIQSALQKQGTKQLTANELWQLTRVNYKEIDAFYADLKLKMAANEVSEIRPKGNDNPERYLVLRGQNEIQK